MYRIFQNCFVLALIVILFGTHSVVRADELEDINVKLEKLNNVLQDSQNATEINEQQLAGLNEQLESIRASVVEIEQGIAKKEQIIKDGEMRLVAQKAILDERIASLYKQRGKSKDALIELLVSNNFTSSLKQYSYQQNLLDGDKKTIVRVVLLVRDIEKKKIKLEAEKARLIPIKEQVAKQSQFLEGEVLSAKKYQQELKNEIASLTARQQEIIAQKQASLNLPQSLGAGPLICTDDRNRNPGFGNAYAFYTFGIPHRVGMSQYGANGRANDGQNHEDILRAYFNNISFENRNMRIKVQGYGEMDIEEYMLGVYEMPNSFHIEALKAQAIASRSYAMAYTNNGQSEICTTQSCQVYKGGNKGGAWEKAVKETAGKVMVADGQVINAWYSSTAGGYTFPNNDVWSGSHKSWTKFLQDGRSGYGSFQDIINNAYDKGSPCLYAAQGWRSEYDNSAWLKSEEVADIANVILLAEKLSAEDKDHLYQVDKPNPTGKETWDFGRVKSELQSRGATPLNSVSNVSISADFGSGKSSTVSISGDTGSRSFNATEFKDWFNLRAPANIQIVGSLFNVEQK